MRLFESTFLNRSVTLQKFLHLLHYFLVPLHPLSTTKSRGIHYGDGAGHLEPILVVDRVRRDVPSLTG